MLLKDPAIPQRDREFTIQLAAVFGHYTGFTLYLTDGQYVFGWVVVFVARQQRARLNWINTVCTNVAYVLRVGPPY